MNHAAVYIPGLNDHKTGKIQVSVLNTWKLLGIKVFYHSMLWSDKNTFSMKFESILSEVDDLLAKGFEVSIIGTSAGASAAINTYAARKNQIHKVICICGKLNNPQTIKYAFIENPAFKESMDLLPQSFAKIDSNDRSKILSLRPLANKVVNPSDTLIENAQNQRMLAVGHGLGISYALTIEAWRIARFIKR